MTSPVCTAHPRRVLALCATCGAAGAPMSPVTRDMLRTANIAHAYCPVALPYRFLSTAGLPVIGPPHLDLVVLGKCIDDSLDD